MKKSVNNFLSRANFTLFMNKSFQTREQQFVQRCETKVGADACKGSYVCLFVCVSVCSLLWYHLTVFLPPFPEVGGLIFLEIWNPWGKVMERIGLRFEHFCLDVV